MSRPSVFPTQGSDRGAAPSSALKWLIPICGFIVLAGYFGPWVNHRDAGLVIMGLDLGEYVKFLPVVRHGQVTVWREGFYLPLVATSLAFSLVAFRVELRYGWPARGLLLGTAMVAAFNLLPPAWIPTRLITPEFRLQTTALGICMGCVLLSPFLSLIPRLADSVGIAVIGVAAIYFPVTGFLHVLPNIAELYREPVQIGWGMPLTVVGIVGLAISFWITPE